MSDAGRTCDELRLMARLVREYDYKEISRMLRKAADTILVMDERIREADRHHRIDMEVIGLMYHPEIVERLEAENAKLRTQLADVTESMGRVEERCAELRELVRTIYMCSCIQCDRCDYGHGNSCSFDAESELRELGVRLDG